MNFLPGLPLNAKERGLLALLEGGQVVRKQSLLQLWDKPVSDMALQVAIHCLRRKLKAQRCYEIITHRGVGYSLAPRTVQERRSRLAGAQVAADHGSSSLHSPSQPEQEQA